MDRGARWATVHGVAKSQTGLSDTRTHTHIHGSRDTQMINQDNVCGDIRKQNSSAQILTRCN